MTFLSNLTIRARLLIGVLVPVLITAGTTAWITASQIQAKGEAELERLGEELLDARKEGLKNLVETARAVVTDARNNSGLSDREAREEARKRLRSITFGKDNYVYAYARNLDNLAYAPDPSLEGPTTNPTTQKLVRDLFSVAGTDGFYEYDWPNPASGEVEPKLSYSIIIPGWDWMMGVGIYVTDIERVLAEAREQIDSAM